MSTMIKAAQWYVDKLNVSVIPVHSALHEDESLRKKPTIKWKPYQERKVTADEINKHFSNGADIAVICGEVSGNLEIIDFDAPETFPVFMETVKGNDPALAEKLITQKTPSGGYHVLYRCEEPIPGNQKLAVSPDGKDVKIETRGEAGYFLVQPSSGYTITDKIQNLPTIGKDDRDLLIWIAGSFNEHFPENRSYSKNGVTGTNVPPSDRPGDYFNQTADWHQLLEQDGWKFERKIGDREHWTRPGKKTGSSATLHPEMGLFVFSTSAGLPTETPLSKFGYIIHYRFNGDPKAAARWIVDINPEYFKDSVNSAKPAFSADSVNSASFSHVQPLSAKSQPNQPKLIDSNRRISQEVQLFIQSSDANFRNNDVYSELYLNSQSERKAARNALLYQEKIGKINRIDGERGYWEVAEDGVEKMSLSSASTEAYKILLPLDISEHAIVRPGAVVLVAGSSNAGKTSFLLRIVKNHLAEFFGSPHMHEDSYPLFINKIKGVPEIRYQNSEMSANELGARIKSFGDDPAEWEKHVSFYERSRSFDKLIAPDGLNLIDFLEIPEEFYLANKYILEIHRKLNTGVAIVAMQKKSGQNYAYGGEQTIQKPRLVINLDSNKPHGFIAKITKLKEPTDWMNKIEGKELDYRITQDGQFVPQSEWRYVNQRQRELINSDYQRNQIKAMGAAAR